MRNKKSHIYLFTTGLVFLLLQGCTVPACKCSEHDDSKFININTDNFDKRSYRVGEKMSFLISVKKPLYMHCFYISGNVIIKISPRHSPRNQGIIHPVRQGLPVKVDGIYADKPIGADQISCIGSPDVLLYSLPKNITYTPVYKKLEYSSMRSIYEVFREVAKSPLLYKSIKINITE